jgi:hypothetical protein
LKIHKEDQNISGCQRVRRGQLLEFQLLSNAIA